MLFIVDGTGPESRSEYEKEMSGGFCRELWRKVVRSQYWRGPTDSGLTTFDTAGEVVKAIERSRGGGRSEPICLAGHSRGGAVMICVAKKLAKAGINVKAMFLY